MGSGRPRGRRASTAASGAASCCGRTRAAIKKYRNGAVDRVVAPVMRDGRPERARDRALDVDGIAEVGGHINDGAALTVAVVHSQPQPHLGSKRADVPRHRSNGLQCLAVPEAAAQHAPVARHGARARVAPTARSVTPLRAIMATEPRFWG